MLLINFKLLGAKKMRPFVNTIVILQLSTSLALGSTLSTNLSAIESKMMSILRVQASAFYEEGKFVKINCNLTSDYDCLVKTEKERFTVYALPKKGIVRKNRGVNLTSSYAVVLYLDPLRNRLVSYGCKTTRTKRLMITNPDQCPPPSLSTMFADQNVGLENVAIFQQVWRTNADIRQEEIQNLIKDLIRVVAGVVYIILFAKYRWVRQITYVILLIGFCWLTLFVVLFGINASVISRMWWL